MDKLADGLQKLNEDDLLQVVQMVHDNKAADSYTKNDVERKFSLYPQDISEKEIMACLTFTLNKTLTSPRSFSTVGEFHVDLYTLPEVLIKMLWDFTADRGAL